MTMPLRRLLASLSLATALAVAPVAAVAAPGGRQFTSQETFWLRVHAHYDTLAPAAAAAEDDDALRLVGNGWALASGPTLELRLPVLEGDGVRVELDVQNPLTYGRKAKEYRGKGTAQITIDGVTQTCTLNVRVKVRKNKAGEFAIIKLLSPDDDEQGFDFKVRARGVETDAVPPAPEPEPEPLPEPEPQPEPQV